MTAPFEPFTYALVCRRTFFSHYSTERDVCTVQQAIKYSDKVIRKNWSVEKRFEKIINHFNKMAKKDRLSWGWKSALAIANLYEEERMITAARSK